MYCAVCTRPDIAYAVSVATRFLSDYGKQHVKYVKRIIRYLAGTTSYCLQFKLNTSEEIILLIMSDSSYADDKVNRRSTYGFNIYLDNNLVSWKSKLTTPIALSTMEAELFGACEGVKEGVWIRKIYEFMTSKKVARTILKVDNRATKDFILNGKISNRSKHIEIRYHYLQELVRKGTLEVEWIRGDENCADIHTKGLPQATHEKHCLKMLDCQKGNHNVKHGGV